MWVRKFVMSMLYLVMAFFLRRYVDKSFDNVSYSDTGV